MNVFTWIVLLVLLLFALRGYRRGFVRTLVSIAFFFLASILVHYATPYVSNALKEYTPLYDYVDAQCEKAFKIEETEDEAELSKLEQTQLIENLQIPETLKKQLLENNNKAGYERLSVDSFSNYVAGYMASLIMNVITYVVTLAVVLLLLRIGAAALDLISKLPVLHGMNQVLGFALGLVQGVLLIWVAFLIITICGSTQVGGRLLTMIYESPVLNVLYDSNVFLRYLMNLLSGF